MTFFGRITLFVCTGHSHREIHTIHRVIHRKKPYIPGFLGGIPSSRWKLFPVDRDLSTDFGLSFHGFFGNKSLFVGSMGDISSSFGHYRQFHLIWRQKNPTGRRNHPAEEVTIHCKLLHIYFFLSFVLQYLFAPVQRSQGVFVQIEENFRQKIFPVYSGCVVDCR